MREQVVRSLLGGTVTVGQHQGRLVTALGEMVRHYMLILWLVRHTGRRALRFDDSFVRSWAPVLRVSVAHTDTDQRAP